jgi:hypothetical protein
LQDSNAAYLPLHNSQNCTHVVLCQRESIPCAMHAIYSPSLHYTSWVLTLPGLEHDYFQLYGHNHTPHSSIVSYFQDHKTSCKLHTHQDIQHLASPLHPTLPGAQALPRPSGGACHSRVTVGLGIRAGYLVGIGTLSVFKEQHVPVPEHVVCLISRFSLGSPDIRSSTLDGLPCLCLCRHQ